MNKNIAARIAKLEAANPPAIRATHRVIVVQGADSQPHIDRLIASGSASPDDLFIIREIVTGVSRSPEFATRG